MKKYNLSRSLLGLGVGLMLCGGCGPEPTGDTPHPSAQEPGTVTQELNVITNGSFETAPPLGFSNYINLGPSTTGLTGWTVTGNVMLMSNTYKPPKHGLRTIGLSAGGVTQTFLTTPGYGYTVQFALSTSPNCATSSRTVDVSANGVTYNFSTSSASWAYRNFVFNATSTSTAITLKNSYTGQTCGPAIDDVTVTGP